MPPHRGPAHLVDELEAGARRALAANGFADAAVERTDAYSNLASGELHRAARTERARLMGTSTAALLRAVFRPTLRLRVAMSHALDRWRQRRLELATYRMLRELDPRTLRDIGFDASEVLSVALEVAGTVDAHRVRSTHVRNGLYP